AAEGRILPHETTVVEREERLAAYLDHVGAASSPVVVATRFPTELRRLVAEATAATPTVSVRSADGVRQTVWAPPAALRERIVAALGEVERAYLVDGHHRIAAAMRVAAADPSRRRFLAAVFPLDELRNLAHHRALLSLGSSRSDELVAELERRFDAVGVDDVGAAVPGRPGEVGVVTRAGMCRFALPTGTGTDPERLARAVLADVVGIEDERTDPRVVHVPGVVAPDELAAAVAEGRLAAVFLLHPLPLEAFVEAAEAGRRLPPKSTWFSPKPRSGLFLAD
ncbi:MAG TPA: DUF1015 family protein, partial [Actinobacteria bacterium]|nr:DUF1015 family protein [Actinomycetota bacterium]